MCPADPFRSSLVRFTLRSVRSVSIHQRVSSCSLMLRSHCSGVTAGLVTAMDSGDSIRYRDDYGPGRGRRVHPFQPLTGVLVDPPFTTWDPRQLFPDPSEGQGCIPSLNCWMQLPATGIIHGFTMMSRRKVSNETSDLLISSRKCQCNFFYLVL